MTRGAPFSPAFAVADDLLAASAQSLGGVVVLATTDALSQMRLWDVNDLARPVALTTVTRGQQEHLPHLAVAFTADGGFPRVVGPGSGVECMEDLLEGSWVLLVRRAFGGMPLARPWAGGIP